MKFARSAAIALSLSGLIIGGVPAFAGPHGGGHSGGHGGSVAHGGSLGHGGSFGHGIGHGRSFGHRNTFRHHDGFRHHGGRGAFFVGGFVGLGAPYYYNRGYPYDYYNYGYPYRDRYYSRSRRCYTAWVWDDYEGDEVPVRVCRR